MKSISKTIDSIEFGKSRQDIVINFKYDDEGVYDLLIQQDNFDNGKHIVTRVVTDLYTKEMQQAMIDSIDLDAERQAELDVLFESPLAQISNFLK
jgi:hypothetical protein